MRTTEFAGRFRRDYKRVGRGRYGAFLDGMLAEVTQLLTSDVVLPDRFRDHALSGVWQGYRDCHLRPDLVLIYGKPDAATLRLARIGSHSELDL